MIRHCQKQIRPLHRSPGLFSIRCMPRKFIAHSVKGSTVPLPIHTASGLTAVSKTPLGSTFMGDESHHEGTMCSDFLDKQTLHKAACQNVACIKTFILTPDLFGLPTSFLYSATVLVEVLSKGLKWVQGHPRIGEVGGYQ